jgi:hypothetical protein
MLSPFLLLKLGTGLVEQWKIFISIFLSLNFFLFDPSTLNLFDIGLGVLFGLRSHNVKEKF